MLAKRSVLIVGATDDPHVQTVRRCLEKHHRIKTLLLDFSTFPTEAVATFACEQARSELRFGSLDLSEVIAAWWRRPYPCRVANSVHQEHAQGECDHFVTGLVWSLESIRWVNDPFLNLRASRKVVQLRSAARAGLRVPRTLVTNSPQEAQEFLAGGGMHVYKRIGTSPGLATKTRLVDDGVLARLESLTSCPVTFQEYVPPGHDVRVTWVDGTMFAMRIDTGSSAFPEDSRLDYNVRHEACELPAEVGEGISRLMAELHLSFGALDFRVSAGGDHFFLEVNPAGQFGYVEMLAGLPISSAVASLLARR